MAELPPDHHCPYRERVDELEGRVAELEQTVNKLQQLIFGRKREQLPSPARELRKKDQLKADPEQVKDKRRQRKEQRRKALAEQRIERKVPDDKRCCQACGSAMKALGPGRETEIIEYEPAHYVRQVFVLETLHCTDCGQGFASAEPPPRVLDQLGYGPRFISHLIVEKCADSLPLYRQAKALGRQGIALSRSTLCDLFQQAGALLLPLAKRIRELIAAEEIVQGDETPLKVQNKDRSGARVRDKAGCRTSYIWTFLATLAPLVCYVYSRSRSGETPVDVLGTSKGTLVVDGHSGYNAVTTPEGRERAGCLAHARRKLFEAREAAPEEVDEALGLILEVYRVEHEARDGGLVASERHHELRQQRSRPAMERLKAWLERQRPHQLPRGALGKAIGYALNQWEALTLFLADARLPVDNNASERALRIIALGRKNWLFVGHDEAGERFAALQTLVACCELNGVNPELYLADVLMRVSSHQVSKLDELLPHRWRAPPDAEESESAEQTEVTAAS